MFDEQPAAGAQMVRGGGCDGGQVGQTVVGGAGNVLGEALAEDPRLPLVSFTGSVEMGR